MTLHGKRQRLSRILLIALLVGSMAVFAACGEDDGDTGVATAPPDVETPADVDPTAPPDTPTAPSPTDTVEAQGTTAETLAAAGEEVYAEHCASCHGEQGEGGVGPAVMGERARLATFGTADALYNYVHVAMPQNAPGSLSDPQYLEVVTFLLLQNDYVQPETPVSMDGLGEISLE